MKYFSGAGENPEPRVSQVSPQRPSGVLWSVQVGASQNYGTRGAVNPFDEPWTSGIFKSAVEGPVFLSCTGAAGDGQADTRFHGGPDKAANCYSFEHYSHWARYLGLDALPFGAFGENLTIASLLEADVCIGDVYAIGPARVQVSQPRQPCWKLARRWRRIDLPGALIEHGSTGWYFRVLAEGVIESGAPIELVDRLSPEWTVSRANRVFYSRETAREENEALAACPAVSEAWRSGLRQRR